MKSTVEIVNGIPEVVIDGKLMSRVIARLDLPGELAPWKLEQYELGDNDVFFTACNVPCSVGFDGEGYDFSLYERIIRRIVKKKPDALLILYVGFEGGAPYAWFRANPDEMARFNTGERLNMPSMGSGKWNRVCDESFRRFTEHFERSPYADHIVGYNPIHTANEWFGYTGARSEPDDGLDGYSPAMREAFRAWLRERYENNVHALQEAWEDAGVAFETAEVPSAGKRLGIGDPHLFCAGHGRGMQVADYYRAYNEFNARRGIHCCRAIKETLPEPKICGMMHGYLFGGCHMHMHGSDFGHQAAELIYDSPYVDFLQAPYNYINRNIRDQIVGVHQSKHPVEALRLRGKVVLTQWDVETPEAVPRGSRSRGHKPLSGFYTVQQLRRDFAAVLTGNHHGYWHEAGPGFVFPIHQFGTQLFGKLHFDHPAIKPLVPLFEKVARRAQERPGGNVAEVAIVSSPWSRFLQHPRRTYMNHFLEALRQFDLPRAGVVFDDLLLSDVPETDRRYRVYIFPDAHMISASLRERVLEKLARDKATALWFYTAGLFDEKGTEDPDGIAALTGIRTELGRKPVVLHTRLLREAEAHFPGERLPKGFGLEDDAAIEAYNKGSGWWTFPDSEAERMYAPTLRITDEDAEPLGKLPATREVHFAYRRHPAGFDSYLLGGPMIPTELLRGLCRKAGVHLYVENGDIVYANSRFVAVTATTDGPRNLRLPRRHEVTDAFTGERIAGGTDSVDFDARRGETVLFELG